MGDTIKIAIGEDIWKWHEKFANSLEKYKLLGSDILYAVLNLDCVDWQDKIASYDIVLWNPQYMGIRLASHMKEKIYFMQYFLNKLVIPNYNTVWHYESKVAQSYIFDHYGINTPKTFVSFDYGEAWNELEYTLFPIVLKKSEGAASSNVKLIRNKIKLERIIENTFSENLWVKSRPDISKTKFILKYFSKRWFFDWIFWRFRLRKDGKGVIYWQEFIPGNRADLRITVIGDRFAYGFWRNNRPNDFRASGSGLIDYDRDVPKVIMNYCIKINNELNFDSMSYDILFTKDSFVINEMSYNYVDKALYNAPGYYEKSTDGNLSFRNGHFWPQELWAKWLLVKAGCLK